ncbi:protein-glutamate O-methyltransferase CheR [candidate division TA06 bacterium]|nr:protein-glutamate O-methyltransferase CheR [candidate division TA06 bacterium]
MTDAKNIDQDEAVDFYSLKLSKKQFRHISNTVYKVSGIDLHQGKEELVKARLLKRLRHLRLSNFEHYLKYLEQDQSGLEVQSMVDMLTTNKTHFFRESEHLDFLKHEIVPKLDREKVRIWSAGCSSGEEPYSIAITLMEALPDIEKTDVRILATDISERMIAKAREGLYEQETLKTLPPQLCHKYFRILPSSQSRRYQTIDRVQSLVSFAMLNLMEEWPMAGPFDVIFCRNVMIYFDKPTQERLVRRFWPLLKEGGYLMVGHSESLTFLSHEYRYVQPAVYQKIKGYAKNLKRPAMAVQEVAS